MLGVQFYVLCVVCYVGIKVFNLQNVKDCYSHYLLPERSAI